MTDAPDSLIDLPLGTPGAGRARYGAAMALYQQGRLSARELEAWRIAAASDTRPADEVLLSHGLPRPTTTPPDPDTALSRLMVEATTYLAPLHCPGAAELRRLLANRAQASALPATTLPSVIATHLPAALTALIMTHPSLAHAIAAASPHLTWTTFESYPHDQIGPAFATGHAFCPLIGPQAPFPADDAEFGLFLIAPHILYRDHSHPAPELYLPLTGPHGWRFGPNRPLIVRPAHHPVWNDPNRPHLTKVGPIPFLAFYGWTREVDKPAIVLPADDWDRLEALRLEPTP